MKTLLHLLFLLIFLPYADAQSNLIWNTELPPCFSEPTTVYDSEKNIIILYSRNCFGDLDLGLIKISPVGDLIWAITYDHGSELDDRGWHIVIDSTDNIYIHGSTVLKEYFSSDLIGLHEAPLTLKFDSNGQLIWRNTISVAEWSFLSDKNDLITDASGNCYISGELNDTITGIRNSYLIKYDSIGNVVWEIYEPEETLQIADTKVKIFQDSIQLRVFKRKYDQNGPSVNVVSSSYDLDGNFLSSDTTTDLWYGFTYSSEDSAGNLYYARGCCASKYNSSFETLWTYTEAGGFINYFVLDSSDNMFLTGSGHRLKIDNDGNLIWRSFKSGNYIVADNNGNAYVGTNTYEDTEYSLHITKYDAAGNEVGTFTRFGLSMYNLRLYDDESLIFLTRDYIEMRGLDISTNELSADQQSLNIFPNPIQESITIDLGHDNWKNAQLLITNINGRIIRKTTIEPTPITSLDVSFLPNGIYLISIQSEEAKYVGRFVVSK